MYTHSTYWLWAAGLLCYGINSLSLFVINTSHAYILNNFFPGSYLLAKVLEATDEVVYEWTHHIVSGHTLKHLAAAMVPVFLTFMLAKRSVEPERYMHVCDTKTAYN